MSEQYYQTSTQEGSGSGDAAPSPGDPEPQRIEAKAVASSNFYFRSQPDLIQSNNQEDSKSGILQTEFSNIYSNYKTREEEKSRALYGRPTLLTSGPTSSRKKIHDGLKTGY